MCEYSNKIIDKIKFNNEEVTMKANINIKKFLSDKIEIEAMLWSNVKKYIVKNREKYGYPRNFQIKGYSSSGHNDIEIEYRCYNQFDLWETKYIIIPIDELNKI